ncbi:hypothetical protein [Lactococcus petauri]|uniref:hypothetical protein n=1 Tax=Lactococcus petauri TaxID=1940789 RepID=UPI0013FDC6EE|nr:hypothetical protein [Lactococcus petauri]NHI76709.1 hypothetical protein [Lactococcus petauri]
MTIIQTKDSRAKERVKISQRKSKQEELVFEEELLKLEIERRKHESKEKRRMRRKMQREKMLANLHQND